MGALRTQASLFLMVLGAILLFAGDSYPRTWDVPSDVPTITEAADSAEYGDTILVAPGTYVCPDNTDYSYEWILLPSGVSLIGSGGAEATVIIDRASTMEPHAVVSTFDASSCLVMGFRFEAEQ